MVRSKRTLPKPSKSGIQKAAAKDDGRRGTSPTRARAARHDGQTRDEGFLKKLRRYPADRALMRLGESRKARNFWDLVSYVTAGGKKSTTASRLSTRKQGVATITREVVRIQREGGLTDRLIARATGAALNTVREWLTLRGQPSGVRAERIAELGSIVERLVRVIEPDYIPVWLNKPIAALDDEKPIDLLRRGQSVRVARLVSSLEDSGAA